MRKSETHPSKFRCACAGKTEWSPDGAMIIPIVIPTIPRQTAEQKLNVEALIIFSVLFGTMILQMNRCVTVGHVPHAGCVWIENSSSAASSSRRTPGDEWWRGDTEGLFQRPSLYAHFPDEWIFYLAARRWPADAPSNDRRPHL